MEKIIAYCGLTCTECPAYLAYKNDDDNLRKETAEKWSKEYGADIKPEAVNCAGCFGTEPLINHCFECKIRACGQERKVKNCGYCDDYPCDTINDFIAQVPFVKDVLDGFHNK